jgi:hypothetical protein
MLDTAHRPDTVNSFFELYLAAGKEDELKLVDVPVLVTNYLDEQGKSPNKDGLNLETSKLVRRFFLFDTLSGITGESYKTMLDDRHQQRPEYVKYAKKVKVTIELLQSASTKKEIVRPLLEITYEEKAVDEITKDSKTTLSFSMDYE